MEMNVSSEDYFFSEEIASASAVLEEAEPRAFRRRTTADLNGNISQAWKKISVMDLEPTSHAQIFYSEDAFRSSGRVGRPSTPLTNTLSTFSKRSFKKCIKVLKIPFEQCTWCTWDCRTQA